MKHQRLLAAISLAVLLGACGGGGTDNASPPAIANTPPVASAGAAQSVVINAVVTLDGSGSSDVNGDALSYACTLSGKPAGSTVALANSTSAKASFTADVAGVYTATLVVNDGKPNGSSASTVSITATAINVAGPGQFINAVHLKTISAAEVTSALALAGDAAFLATPSYAVQAWRLTYLTVDGEGRPIAASGLVAIPQKPANALSPVLSYQHATIKLQANAPSNLADLGAPPVVLASLGYIVVAADYVGYGVSSAAPHPYLLSAPSASAVIDLLTAAKYWRQTQHVPDNKQLFLTGYSEGGYVTMAAHRALQAGTSMHRNELVRAIAGAGPYNVGATLDQLLAILRRDYFPLGQLLNPGFLKYLSDADRQNARDLLLLLSLGADADVVFMPTVIDNYLADDRAAIETFSDVFDWAPQIPVHLFHGRDDLTVPYLSASSTLQAMQTRGAGDRVTLTDCVAEPAGHSQCVLPYWRFVLDQFAKAARDL
jgi:pimeloyl-ACP methyl ester carboxylesterase